MTLNEETDRLLNELLIAFEDLDAEDMIPVCAFMRGVGRLQGLPVYEVEMIVAYLPAWETVGWFRSNIRKRLGELSRNGVTEDEVLLEGDLQRKPPLDLGVEDVWDVLEPRHPGLDLS